MTILIVITFIIPYRLAFVVDESLEWKVAYYFFDFFFLVDICFCFITSYTDPYKQIEVTNVKMISKNYLKSWFMIDVLSIFPFDAVMDGYSNANSLVRVARIGKLYKIIRLFRLIKILKMVKSNKKLVHHFSEHMKINNGMERLLMFLGVLVILVHTAACFFVITA